LADNADARQQYFNEFMHRSQACGLLFFDPDNGMEVTSTHYGQKDSSKYLYWSEARKLYELGYSLLVFQHHGRVKHEDLTSRLIKDSLANIGNAPNFYRTTYATFLLIAQGAHRELFKELNKTIEAQWQPVIKVEES
jgi:DNA-binding FadR family transcriptional regulator